MAYNCPSLGDPIMHDSDRGTLNIPWVEVQTEARPRYTATMIPTDMYLREGDIPDAIPDFFRFSVGRWGCSSRARDIIQKITDNFEFHQINLHLAEGQLLAPIYFMGPIPLRNSIIREKTDFTYYGLEEKKASDFLRDTDTYAPIRAAIRASEIAGLHAWREIFDDRQGSSDIFMSAHLRNAIVDSGLTNFQSFWVQEE
jgi:hypothetical protein